MNEIRRDYISEKYVVFSPKRAKRPHLFSAKKGEVMDPSKCPFCPGNEKMTPKEIIQKPKKNWKVRLIPNKFPALCDTKFNGEEGKGFFNHYKPYGSHEVVIETPDHSKDFHDLSIKDMELSLGVLIKRYKEHIKRKEIVYVTMFKNEGKMAGASIGHSHSQIIASPVFPKKISEKMTAAEKFYKKENRCPYCDIIKKEKEKKKRIVSENKEFVVIAPYASTWPYETWLFPKRHISDISKLDSSQKRYFLKTIKKLLNKYNELFGDLPYHIVYNSFPKSDFWHFHIEIYPKLKIYGGFEYFGLFVNEVMPEYAAKKLRFR